MVWGSKQKSESCCGANTYNTEDSPVVTDLSTSSAISRLSRGERTGSRAFYYLWSYVLAEDGIASFMLGIACGRCGVGVGDRVCALVLALDP